MIPLARHPNKRGGFNMAVYQQKKLASNQDYIDAGEPFFVSGQWKGRCPLWIFRPGTYWSGEVDGYSVVGESMDSDDGDTLSYILSCRRKGEIYGKWYSKHCQEGEDGFINCRLIKQITGVNFNTMKSYM